LALVASLTLSVSSTALAQRSHIGPQIGYNFDYEALVLGGQLSLPLGYHLELYPSFDYFFVDAGTGTVWAINADLKYRLPIQGADFLYIGGGVNFTRSSFGGTGNTDTRGNVIAGLESRRGNIHPFAEFRLTAGQGSTTQLVGGLNITLGGH
jgi:hypothetical protein